MLAQAENIKFVISICLFRHFIFNRGNQNHLGQIIRKFWAEKKKNRQKSCAT